MSTRISFTVAILCLAASMAAFGQSQGQEYLFQFATPPNNFTQASGYIDSGNLSSPAYIVNGPGGIAAVLPTPDGTKFYLVGTAGKTSLESVDSNFDASSYHQIGGLGASCTSASTATCGAPTAATITPDGKYLLVSSDQLYVFATATDGLVASLPIQGSAQLNANTPGPAVCMSCWIAVTPDSQYAFLLTSTASQSVLTKFSLATLQQVSTLNNLGSGATSVSVSPTGQLYVTDLFRIYVIDPIAFNANTYINPGDATPGPLRFTPDGTTAYAVNRGAAYGGGSMLQINLVNQSVTSWPPTSTTNPPQFDDIVVASSSRFFAYSSALGALYDVSTNPFAATVAAPSLVTSTSGILDTVVRNEIVTASVSNEIPAAQYLFLVVANGNQTDLYRVTLSASSGTLTSNGLSTFSGGVMETTYQPATTSPTQFVAFNNNQTLASNGVTSLPLIAQVLNAQGLPVYGQSATFTTDSTTGLIINSPSATTNAQGFVQTTVSVPSAGATCAMGVCTVTLTVGGQNEAFTVNVPYSSTGGGGGTGTGTASQVTIVSGDGQLMEAGYPASEPLTVLVTSPTGTPLANQTVTFAVSGPFGINATSATTDNTGQASVGVVPGELSQAGFQQGTVTATVGTLGSVTFSETVFELAPGLDGLPTVYPLTPAAGNQIQVTAGTTLTAGIQMEILWNGLSCPNCAIPGVGIDILAPAATAGQPPAVKCQGSSNSNAQGIASCNVVAAVCQPGTYGIVVSVGGFTTYDFLAAVNAGGSDTLTLISGNKQTGNAGAPLLTPLVVQALDTCGNPAPGQTVTWKVTQGSATLSPATVITAPSGDATTMVTLGQTPGQVTITATLSTGASVSFSLVSQSVATSLVLTSGGAQTGTTSMPFAQPLIFTMTDKSGNPVPGATVNFTVSSGSATVSPTSTTTTASGQAQTAVTAGSSAGVIVITAAGAGLTANAQLTSQPPGPTLTASSFVNAASFTAGLVPCGLGVVTGNGVAPGIQGTVLGPSFGPLSYSLGPINSLTIGGIQAPISSVTNENGTQQATFQTPCELPTTSSTTSVVITVNNVPATIPGVQVLAAQPGIFTYSGPNNIQYGAVISASNSNYVTPSNFAVRGQTYYVIVTGLGQTTPAASTDNPGAGQPVNATIVVGVNNAGVGTGSATYAPGIVGAYLVPFTIPLTAATGPNQPLSVAAIVNGQVIYSNSVFIPGVQ